MKDPQDVWFLAQLKPNSARLAQENLHRQGFGTFLPLEDRTQTRNGKFVTRLDPLFPGYIFVALNPADGQWRKVNSTRGITKLVSLRDGPTPVPSGIVETLMEQCDPNGRIKSEPDLQVGEDVTVTAGPFTDLIAKVLEIEPDRRVWVLMDIMGRQTRTSLAPNALSRQKR